LNIIVAIVVILRLHISHFLVSLFSIIIHIFIVSYVFFLHIVIFFIRFSFICLRFLSLQRAYYYAHDACSLYYEPWVLRLLLCYLYCFCHSDMLLFESYSYCLLFVFIIFPFMTWHAEVIYYYYIFVEFIFYLLFSFFLRSLFVITTYFVILLFEIWHISPYYIMFSFIYYFIIIPYILPFMPYCFLHSSLRLLLSLFFIFTLFSYYLFIILSPVFIIIAHYSPYYSFFIAIYRAFHIIVLPPFMPAHIFLHFHVHYVRHDIFRLFHFIHSPDFIVITYYYFTPLCHYIIVFPPLLILVFPFVRLHIFSSLFLILLFIYYVFISYFPSLHSYFECPPSTYYRSEVFCHTLVFIIIITGLLRSAFHFFHYCLSLIHAIIYYYSCHSLVCH